MSFCRKVPRVELDVFLNKFVEGVPYLCRTTDISEDGLYLGSLIEPDQPQLTGGLDEPGATVVGMQFQLPGTEEVIYAEGEVIRYQERKRTGGFGVRFTSLAPKHRALISQYVRQSLAA